MTQAHDHDDYTQQEERKVLRRSGMATKISPAYMREVRALAHKLYGLCRDSPSRYKELAPEVRRLRNALEEIEELLCANQIRSLDHLNVLDVIKPCKVLLHDIDLMLQAYRSKDATTEAVAALKSRLSAGVQNLSRCFEELSGTAEVLETEPSIELSRPPKLPPMRTISPLTPTMSFAAALSATPAIPKRNSMPPLTPDRSPSVQSSAQPSPLIQVRRPSHSNDFSEPRSQPSIMAYAPRITTPTSRARTMQFTTSGQDMLRAKSASPSLGRNHQVDLKHEDAAGTSDASELDASDSSFMSVNSASSVVDSFDWHSPFASIDPLSVDIASASSFILGNPKSATPVSDINLTSPEEEPPADAIVDTKLSPVLPLPSIFIAPQSRHSSGPLPPVAEESVDGDTCQERRDSGMTCSENISLKTARSQLTPNEESPSRKEIDDAEISLTATPPAVDQTLQEDARIAPADSLQPQVDSREENTGHELESPEPQLVDYSGIEQVELNGLRLNPPDNAARRPASLPPRIRRVSDTRPTMPQTARSHDGIQAFPMLPKMDTSMQRVDESPVRAHSVPITPAFSSLDALCSPPLHNLSTPDRELPFPTGTAYPSSPPPPPPKGRYCVVNPSPPSIIDESASSTPELRATPISPLTDIPTITIDGRPDEILSTGDQDNDSVVSALESGVPASTPGDVPEPGHSRDTSASSTSNGLGIVIADKGYIDIGIRKSVSELSPEERAQLSASTSSSLYHSPHESAVPSRHSFDRASSIGNSVKDFHVEPVRSPMSPSDSVRIERICRCWHEQRWNQADAYLLAMLNSCMMQDWQTARRLHHLLGVSASFQGQWERALTHFIAVLEIPIKSIDRLDDGDLAALYWMGDLYSMLNRRTEASLAYSLALQIKKARSPVSTGLHTILRMERDAIMLGLQREKTTPQWWNVVEQDHSQAKDSVLNPSIVVADIVEACLVMNLPPTHIMLESSHRSRISRLHELDETFLQAFDFSLTPTSFVPNTAWPLPFDPFFSIGNVVQGRLCENTCDLLSTDIRLPKSRRFDCFTCNDLRWLIQTIRRFLKALDMRWTEVSSDGVWFVARFAVKQSNIITANYFAISLFKTLRGCGAEICADGMRSARVIKQGSDYPNGAHHSYEKRLRRLFKEYLTYSYKTWTKAGKFESGLEDAVIPAQLMEQASIFIAKPPPPPPRH